MTMSADRQLVAFAGELNGRIVLVDWRQPSGQNHKVLREAGDFTPISHSVGIIEADPALWEDALKLSGCINLTVYAFVVRGGNEDVVDIMRCRSCKVVIEDAYPQGKYVSTQKGASEDIILIIHCQHGHGTEVDHDYGNRADRDNDYTSSCTLDVCALGNTISVRTIRSEPPTLVNGPYRYVFPKPYPRWLHTFLVWVYTRF